MEYFKEKYKTTYTTMDKIDISSIENALCGLLRKFYAFFEIHKKLNLRK